MCSLNDILVVINIEENEQNTGCHLKESLLNLWRVFIASYHVSER